MGASALCATGCGGRTTTLDPDAYGPSLEASGGSGDRGGASTAGSPVSGGKPASGGSTTSGGGPVDRDLTETTCGDYCPRYGVQCKSELQGKDCMSTCRGELNGYGDRCQRLGVAALQCLTPYFSSTGSDCKAAASRALDRCEASVTKFTECKLDFAGDATTKPSIASSCPTTVQVSEIGCDASFYCSAGTYTVICSAMPNGTAHCSCLPPSPMLAFEGTIKASANTCLEAASLCP